MRNYEVAFKGVTPILFHYNNLEARDSESARGKSGGKAGDDRYPADRWKSCLYVDDKRVVWPAENALAAALKVGSMISIGGKKTLKAASQGVMFEHFYLDFFANGKAITRKDIEGIKGTFQEQADAANDLGFALFVKPCRVNGKCHVRVRPRFDSWEVRGKFSVDDPELTTVRLTEMWSLAGVKAGFGDWRPASPTKPGMYGRFEATVRQLD